MKSGLLFSLCSLGREELTPKTADPKRFDAMINTTYIVAFTISMLMGAIGYAMLARRPTYKAGTDQ